MKLFVEQIELVDVDGKPTGKRTWRVRQDPPREGFLIGSLGHFKTRQLARQHKKKVRRWYKSQKRHNVEGKGT